VVVTSYEAVIDESCRRFFKGVAWQGLIVDEGQRLKNDKSVLHNALNALNVQYRVLLSGKSLTVSWLRKMLTSLQGLPSKTMLVNYSIYCNSSMTISTLLLWSESTRK